MRARQSDPVVAIALTALCSATVWAAEPSKLEPAKIAAVATDSPVTQAVTDVAREVVRLQEELGGSITAGFGAPQPWTPSTPAPRPQPYVPAAKSPINALREVAWQLDQSAHQLELLDLYDQADALREAANKLRRDAREMKVQSTATKSK